MMMHILLRLPDGDRTLESYAAAWGDKWWDRAERIGELKHCSWDSPGTGDAGSKEAQLDWGAFAYELSLDEIRGLLPPRPNPDAKHEPSLSTLYESVKKSHKMLDRLNPAGRYAIVWMECY